MILVIKTVLIIYITTCKNYLVTDLLQQISIQKMMQMKELVKHSIIKYYQMV